MDLLLDVNVAIDICQPRPQFAPAALRAISRCRASGGRVWLYAGSVQTLHYTLAHSLTRDAASSGRVLSNAAALRLSGRLLKAFSAGLSWLAALTGEGDVWDADDAEDEQLIRAMARFDAGRIALLSRDRALQARHPDQVISPQQFLDRPVAALGLAFTDLAAQQGAVRPALETGLHRVLLHGQYILVPEVAELEAALAARTGSPHCITVASGTEALLIALMALGLKPGDEVITMPFTFAATAETIVLLGGVPVFVDIEPDTCLLDATLIEAAVTKRTRAIMPVSLYGQCCDMDAIEAIAARHGLAVIEDAAQSFGATYRGRASGALSTFGCTSFFPSKPLGCYGDGGAIFTADAALAQACREIRVHGQSARYVHSRVGVGGRMDTLQCAIVLAKLERFDHELERRRALGARYHALLEASGIQLLALRPDRDSVWGQYTVLVEAREQLADALREAGIPTAVHYPRALHHQPAYAHLAAADACPHSVRAAQRVLSLPMSADLTHAQQDAVVAALRAAVRAAVTA